MIYQTIKILFLKILQANVVLERLKVNVKGDAGKNWSDVQRILSSLEL